MKRVWVPEWVVERDWKTLMVELSNCSDLMLDLIMLDGSRGLFSCR